MKRDLAGVMHRCLLETSRAKHRGARPRLTPLAIDAHRRVLDLVRTARASAALPDFVADTRGAAAAAWLGWRSFLGDDAMPLDPMQAAELTRQRDEALREHGVDVRKRHPIATWGELLAALREIEARDRRSYKPTTRRPSHVQWGQWLVFLVDVGGLRASELADLVRTAPAAWSVPPFPEHEVPRLGLERRIEVQLDRARNANQNGLVNS